MDNGFFPGTGDVHLYLYNNNLLEILNKIVFY